MGSRNEDRSFSTMGASGVAIAPHIRDALEQARLAAQESEAPREPLMEAPSFPKPASETARDAEDLRKALERANAVEGDLSRALLKVSSSGRRESSLVNRLAEKEKQVRDLRAYVHDALRLRDKAHAYLRASHLDPPSGSRWSSSPRAAAAARRRRRLRRTPRSTSSGHFFPSRRRIALNNFVDLQQILRDKYTPVSRLYIMCAFKVYYRMLAVINIRARSF